MPPKLTEDEIDDLLYFARTGEASDYDETIKRLSNRENCSLIDLLSTIRDEYSGNGILHMAAANGHSDLLAQIIAALSTPPQNPPLLSLINTPNMSGNTPLHWAALNGHLECVKVLVDNGADPTITNKAGHDPVYEAELNDRKEVVEWVLKEGGDGLETGFGGGSEEGDQEEGVDEEQEETGEGSTSRLDESVRNGLENLGFKEAKEL